MNLDTLFDDALAVTPPAVTGKWCTIRLHPDVGTGEILNIGVAFAPKRGTVKVQLLPHAKAFHCMYGLSGQENFGFLLRVLQEQLVQIKKAADMPRVSPQVSFGPWKFAAGQSEQEILANLYRQSVPLGFYVETEFERPVNTTVGNLKFRDSVKALVQGADEIFRDKPVKIHAPDGKQHALDMPVWHEPGGLFPQRRFGTLVSCQYRLDVYRKAALGPACQHFNTAAELIKNSPGLGFFIALRPRDNTPGFSHSDITAIENEIDDLTWPYQKNPKLQVRVVHSAREAATLVQELMQ